MTLSSDDAEQQFMRLLHSQEQEKTTMAFNAVAGLYAPFTARAAGNDVVEGARRMNRLEDAVVDLEYLEYLTMLAGIVTDTMQDYERSARAVTLFDRCCGTQQYRRAENDRAAVVSALTYWNKETKQELSWEPRELSIAPLLGKSLARIVHGFRSAYEFCTSVRQSYRNDSRIAGHIAGDKSVRSE